jgi:hypothetical protein
MVIFQCSRCGATVSASGKPETLTCPSCGTVYTLSSGDFDWTAFFWGALAGVIFSAFVFTATGRAIMEALGYRVVEKVSPKER